MQEAWVWHNLCGYQTILKKRHFRAKNKILAFFHDLYKLDETPAPEARLAKIIPMSQNLILK